MQKTLNKKGISVWNLMNIATVFVILAVSLGIGVWVNEEMEAEWPTTAVLCEAVVFSANQTSTVVSYPYIKSIQYAYNDTDCSAAQLLGPGNYTILNHAGFDDIYLNCTGGFECAEVGAITIAFNYTTWDTNSDPTILVTKNSTDSIAKLAQWLPIIAIVIAAGVVIGTLMVYFTRRG